MTDTITASELYAQLGIAEPFKEWIARQPGFGQFKSFFGTLPDGKLGKDYRLNAEQAALLLPSVPSIPQSQPEQTAKKAKLQPIPGVQLPDGYYSIEAYTQAVFGEVFKDKRAKNLGIALSAIARRSETVLEKAPHPVWGTVNSYPKAMLDRFFKVKTGKGAGNCNGLQT